MHSRPLAILATVILSVLCNNLEFCQTLTENMNEHHGNEAIKHALRMKQIVYSFWFKVAAGQNFVFLVHNSMTVQQKENRWLLA
jgi:uncharacterized membrane protein